MITEDKFSVQSLATGILQCDKQCHLFQTLMSAEKDQESAAMENVTISKEAFNVFVRMATS